METFCIECDAASFEAGGKYVEGVWYCDECLIKLPDDQPRVAFKKLQHFVRRLIEGIESDE